MVSSLTCERDAEKKLLVIYCWKKIKRKKSTVNINNRHKYRFVLQFRADAVHVFGFSSPISNRAVICYKIASISIVARVLKGVRLKIADNIWIHLSSPFLFVPFFFLLLSSRECFMPFFFVSRTRYAEASKRQCTYSKSRSTRNHLFSFCLSVLGKFRNEMNKVLLNI